MTRTIDIDEPGITVQQLVEQAMHGGEIILTRDEQPVARLVPSFADVPPDQSDDPLGRVTMADGTAIEGVPRSEFKRHYVGMGATMWMSDDFDEPLDEFKHLADKPGGRLLAPDDYVQREGSLPDFKPGFSGAAGLIWMSDDFDEPLQEFKEYME